MSKLKVAKKKRKVKKLRTKNDYLNRLNRHVNRSLKFLEIVAKSPAMDSERKRLMLIQAMLTDFAAANKRAIVPDVPLAQERMIRRQEDGKLYKSLQEAAEDVDGIRQGIFQAVNRKCRYKGFHYEYAFDPLRDDSEVQNVD